MKGFRANRTVGEGVIYWEKTDRTFFRIHRWVSH